VTRVEGDQVGSKRSAFDVFLAFLGLGLTSFGGPIAHLGYFRKAFVLKRRWLEEQAFAEMLAVCQFLPGPTSSQMGMSIGFHRAGWMGALAAWVGFTAPSALLMAAFAVFASFVQSAWLVGLTHGLKLVAVAVVADALFGMARTLTPDVRRAVIAVIAFVVTMLASAMVGQVVAIALGAVLGCWLTRSADVPPPAPLRTPSRATGLALLAIFAVVLVGGPLFQTANHSRFLQALNAFFAPGALVFGGGHVVLPLLKETVVASGLVSEDAFLSGYGAAQALPGPLFTFATFLGIEMAPPGGGAFGALTATVAIFLPGALSLFGVLPFWNAVREVATFRAAIRGANAAVVGVLGAAFYNPIWLSGVSSFTDVCAALFGFLLLNRLKAPPILIVILGAGFGLAQTRF
jgi:chromate transporter